MAYYSFWPQLRDSLDRQRPNEKSELSSFLKRLLYRSSSRNRQVVLRDGVDLSNAGGGVQLLGELVNSTDNYRYYAGTDGRDAAGLFQGSFKTDKNGESKLTDDGKLRMKRFEGTISNESNAEGTLVGTSGRGLQLQPANLANGVSLTKTQTGANRSN